MLMTNLSPGLADPVLDSQAVFRAALDALSRPLQPVAAPRPPQAPEPLLATSGALALALADLDTPVWLDAALDTATVRDWLRFHAGCPLTTDAAEATFALIGDATALTDLDRFAIGTAEYPDRSATLIVQVAGLHAGEGPTFTGPGIKDSLRLRVDGPPDTFWEAWTANRALFPQGVDVVFATPTEFCGLPRTTKAEI